MQKTAKETFKKIKEYKEKTELAKKVKDPEMRKKLFKDALNFYTGGNMTTNAKDYIVNYFKE